MPSTYRTSVSLGFHQLDGSPDAVVQYRWSAETESNSCSKLEFGFALPCGHHGHSICPKSPTPPLSTNVVHQRANHGRGLGGKEFQEKRILFFWIPILRQTIWAGILLRFYLGLSCPTPTPYKKGDRLWRLWRLIRAVEDSTHWITGSDLESVNTILALYCHMMTIISDCRLVPPPAETLLSFSLLVLK